MKKALITGITGQDGSYLAELLLDKGYEVHGIVRRASTFNRQRIDHLRENPQGGRRLRLHYGDLGDTESLTTILSEVRPDEVYNRAAQSHVGISFRMPTYTGDVSGLGAVRLLEAVRRIAPDARFYQTSSSELFGKVVEVVHYEHATDGTDIYILSYDYGYPEGLIKWFVPSSGNEVAADVDLSGFTARFEVVGL